VIAAAMTKPHIRMMKVGLRNSTVELLEPKQVIPWQKPANSVCIYSAYTLQYFHTPVPMAVFMI